MTAFNPFQPFVSGDLQNNVIGQDIHVRYFEIRYHLRHIAQAEALSSPVYMRVTLVRTPVIWPLGAPTAPYIPYGNIPSDVQVPTVSVGTFPLNSKWNSNIVKVLSSKTILLRGYTGNTAATTNFRVGRVRLRGLKGKKTFMTQYSSDVDLSLGRIKQGQFYVIIELYTGNASSSTNNIDVRYDWSMYYKDM